MPGRKDKTCFGGYWDAAARGQSGIETTSLFPKLNGVIDDLCIIRSMHGDQGDHFAGTLHMHSGSNGSLMPGLGAWISYGLGTANANLPSHMVFCNRVPYAGAQSWSSNFLPAIHQGVRLEPDAELLPNLNPRERDAALRAIELNLVTKMNDDFARAHKDNSDLSARTASFQTATRMQDLAPDLFSYDGESDATLKLYGLHRDKARPYAWQCLMARRMSEAGVRFIEIVDTGANDNWDQHSDLKKHEKLARNIDQGAAALITDLKQRGLLEDTLVIWATEFGRTPWLDQFEGRGHYAHAFTCWLAGGGVQGGTAYGATDEFGATIVDKPMHVHDFHATILHSLGLDHKKLTFRHAGRDFRLTDVAGNVAKGVFS